jgi:dTDP-4-dehydrorhamnose 3,5-epimerase
MNIVPTSIPDVCILEPTVFNDERGYLYENFNARCFATLTGVSVHFVQENHSRSVNNVLRGLHYQLPRPQGKLVRLVKGEVFDVAVDIRKTSPTFGHWTGTILSADNKRQLWIPEGFAHGFVVMSDVAELLYKTTDYWASEHEHCIRWNDPTLGIGWPMNKAPILSPKDQNAQWFLEAEVFP